MARTESEQEFVLGNKQLLSAFFVVVALLGVFFVMGYIIGRNTSADSSAKKPAQAEPVPAASSGSDTAPPTETAPVQTPQPRNMPAERPEAPAAEKPAEQKAVPAESTPGHTYLQVSAVKRPAAESIVKTLKDKGFPALLGESSKPELFRVLVGPYSDTESLSKAKSDLKAMGFEAQVSR